MNGKMANIFESDVKCEFHSNTLQLFSNINNRTILRGRCLEHIGNACVAYSGIDKLNGQLLYITEWKIQYNKLSTKCSILCKNGCVDHTPQNIIAGIEDQLKLLYQIDHENLIRYETVIWSENENFFSIYLVRNLVRGSTLRSLTKSIGWTSSGIRKIISALFDVIAHLHKNVVAHGNINDLSIFIDESGICKVTDYCLIPYLNYLTRESQVHYLSMKEDDLTAMGDLIASFAISSEQITDLIKKCKLNQDLTALMGHPFLLNISITRFEVDFTVLKHLGAGGFGDVLHVKNYHDEKEYAIKRIRLPKNDTIANDSSRLEVRHLSMLEHVNIVRYFASWSEYLDEAVFNKYLSDDDFYDDDSMSVDSESDDETEASSRTDLWVQPKNKKFKCDQLPKVHVMYILMELCDERNLRKVIDNSELHNDAERIHKYFMEIAAGLKYIHSQDIIHSDLKPDNIFLSQSGHIKIGDFGLATTISLTLKQYREKNSKDSDEEVETLGTPLYISPEVIRTSIPNPKMDMYSFGVILFEMCHPPFSTGMQRIKTLDGIRRAEIAIPPYMKHNTVFFSYERIVKDLLNHDMRRRPTAKQLLRPFGNYKRDLTFNSQPI